MQAGDPLVGAAMREAGLPTPYRVMVQEAQLRPGTDEVNSSVVLFSRDDALDHVEVVSSTEGAGVWITDRYADVRGLQPGDTLEFAYGSAPIAGVYRDLAGDGMVTDLPAYWCS